MPTPAIDDDLYFEILKSERVRVRALATLMGILFTLSLALFVLQLESVSGYLFVEGRVPVRAIVWQVVKDDYPARPLDAVTVRGRQEPVTIYALR